MDKHFTFSRRDWLKLAGAGFLGTSYSGWLEQLAHAAAANPARKRACILLWMNGGPSQMDTFDLKPGHKNGGSFKETATSVPGIKISEHLPLIAKQMKRMAIVRSMSTKEADHARATYLMRTGRTPGGPIQYPSLGSLVAKELQSKDAELPGFVSIGPSRFLSPAAYSSGFLGPNYAPLIVGEGEVFANPQGRDPSRALKVQDLDLPGHVNAARAADRLELLGEMETDFLRERNSIVSLSHKAAYQRAVTMMKSSAVKAFNLDEEPAKLRDRYGRNLFGQGCLLARRLVEQGVPFIEVTLSRSPDAGGGWDTHTNNFTAIKSLSGVLDPAWATLMEDLADKGMLDTTLVVWMGEFGRTPKINGNNGRDHWANSWSTVLAGGGIKGGQVYGKTNESGMEVADNPVSVPNFLATVGQALGLDITKANNSNVGRPIRFVDPGSKPIKEVLA